MMVGVLESKNAKQAYYVANNHGGYYYDKNDGFFYSPSVGFYIFKSTAVVFALCPCFLPYCGRSVKGADYSLWYVGLRVLRFLLAGLLCWLIGRKNKGLFLQNPEQCKKILKVFAAAIVLCLIFHFDGFFAHLYGKVSNMIGVYTNAESHLFLSVLWEQLFNGDLLWSVLLCFPLLFAGNLSKKQA